MTSYQRLVKAVQKGFLTVSASFCLREQDLGHGGLSRGAAWRTSADVTAVTALTAARLQDRVGRADGPRT